MKSILLTSVALSAGLLLTGCASQSASDAVRDASASFQKIKDDADVLRTAPRDVIRAGESLGRAERLSGYWGSSDDVAHYAYLSQRYSEIARQHSIQALDEERLQRLELERQRLQLSLREMKLLSTQQQGKRVEEQIMDLSNADDERGLVMTLGDRLFDTGQADLSAAANRTVLKLVQFLQINPKRTVRIEGYTDSTGSSEDNLALSRDRAQAVADTLIDLGIDDSRIQVQGLGAKYPLDSNATDAGRGKNRRVEVVFSDDKGRLAPAR